MSNPAKRNIAVCGYDSIKISAVATISTSSNYIILITATFIPPVFHVCTSPCIFHTFKDLLCLLQYFTQMNLSAVHDEYKIYIECTIDWQLKRRFLPTLFNQALHVCWRRPRDRKVKIAAISRETYHHYWNLVGSVPHMQVFLNNQKIHLEP